MSRSRSPSPVRGALSTPLLAAALAALACLFAGTVAGAAPPVLTPSGVRSAPGQFIVVAVNNPVSARPGAVGGTAHGYGNTSNYRVSASAAAVIVELARQYSLTRVSEWPIEQLSMHCVLFRIPPGTTRAEVIPQHRAERRRGSTTRTKVTT